MGTHTLTVKECVFSVCRETGRATFRLSTLGQGSNGSRDVSFVTLMDDINISGEAAVEPVTLDMECTVFNGSACTAAPLNVGQTQTMTAWAVSPSAFFAFTSPTAGATGTDLLSWYDFEGTVNASDETVSTGSNGFRCGSASYLTYAQGCVFDVTQELWYDVSTSNPEVNESAQHILDAQGRPDLTLPPWAGKTVPGSIFSGQPLTRVFYDMTLRNANRAKAVATCRQYWGTYSDLGLDCDEYPFATTLEGAAAGDDRYSARALDAADNQKAGSMLGVFYGRQRVLDNDTFYVVVIP